MTTVPARAGVQLDRERRCGRNTWCLPGGRGASWNCPRGMRDDASVEGPAGHADEADDVLALNSRAPRRRPTVHGQSYAHGWSRRSAQPRRPTRAERTGTARRRGRGRGSGDRQGVRFHSWSFPRMSTRAETDGIAHGKAPRGRGAPWTSTMRAAREVRATSPARSQAARPARTRWRRPRPARVVRNSAIVVGSGIGCAVHGGGEPGTPARWSARRWTYEGTSDRLRSGMVSVLCVEPGLEAGDGRRVEGRHHVGLAGAVDLAVQLTRRSGRPASR